MPDVKTFIEEDSYHYYNTYVSYAGGNPILKFFDLNAKEVAGYDISTWTRKQINDAFVKHGIRKLTPEEEIESERIYQEEMAALQVAHDAALHELAVQQEAHKDTLETLRKHREARGVFY